MSGSKYCQFVTNGDRHDQAKQAQAAVKEVISGNTSLSAASRKFGVPKATLSGYVQRSNEVLDENFLPGAGRQPALGLKFEDALEQQMTAWQHNGSPMTMQDFKDGAFKCAMELQPTNKIVQEWKENGKVGSQWVRNFLRRRPKISAYVKRKNFRPAVADGVGYSPQAAEKE